MVDDIARVMGWRDGDREPHERGPRREDLDDLDE
jgi:hypothetical protein